MELGGMYLRLYHCRTDKKSLHTLKSEKISFYQKKIYTPDLLFADLFKHLNAFISDLDSPPSLLVFSFANALKPVNSKKNQLDGEILFWGKNHRQQGLLGLRLGTEFENYLHEHGLKNLQVNVANDSCLAVLSARMLQTKTTGTVINLVAGSGTNISVGYDHGKNYKVINLEFGNLDFCPYSNFDHQLNHESSTPNRFRTEKLFSGAWQNRLLNIIVERAVSEGLIKKEPGLEKLGQMTSEQLEDFFSIPQKTPGSFEHLRFAWREIARRGSFVCALAVSGIIRQLTVNHLLPEGITIVEVGALLEHCPHFRHDFEKNLQQFLKEDPHTAKIKPEMVLEAEPTCCGAATLLSALGH
jgi:hexokinase